MINILALIMCSIFFHQSFAQTATSPSFELPITDKKYAELEQFFANKECADVQAIVGHAIETAGISQFVCRLYEKNPQLATKLFSSCYGSNMDNFTPRCDFSTEITKADGLKEYTEHLSSLYGANLNECGSSRYSAYANQNSAILLTLYDTNIPDLTLNPSSDLQNYALKGLWEKEQYEKFLQLQIRAQKGLEKYYIDSKKIAPNIAKKLAHYYVVKLANTYIKNDSSKNISLDEINSLLNTDSFKSVTVEYLLKLAVVNNYSISDIKKILAAGVNVHSKLAEEALMNSVRRLDILKILIEKGVNVNAQNEFGKTPLMYAIQYGTLDAVKMLVEHKANVNLATFATMPYNCDYGLLKAGNRTPLMYAAWHANNEVINYLLAKGANPDIKDTDLHGYQSTAHDYQFYLTMNDFHR